ncbi:MAG: penicillin acylase family protein [Gemmatimonadota bacterium]
MRRQGEPAPTALPAIVSAPRLAPTEASRRWATLLQQIFEVDPLVCPTCHGPMRVVAFITQTSVIDQILAHLRTRDAREAHAGPRSPPSTRAPASRGTTRAPRPFADAPPVTCVRPQRPATTRGPSAWAAVPPARLMGPRRHRSPHGDRRSHGPRGARTSRRARRPPPVGARAGGDRVVYSTDPDRHSYPGYIQIVGWSAEGAVEARGIVTYSQSDDPDSPHFGDLTRLFSKGQMIRLPFTEAEIAADPALRSVRLRQERRPSGK